MKIRILAKGPYIVSGGVPLHDASIGVNGNGESTHWVKGADYAVPETYSLCRCGHSKNPPFCDGSHLRAGFDGAETASREPFAAQAETFEGPEINLADAQALCAFARFCDRANGVWEMVENPDSPADTDAAIQEACDCPSGRLVIHRKSGEQIEPELPPSIGVVSDPHLGVIGPLWVRGSIPIESADGTQYEVRNRVTLCRCGKSSNKPFCDGSHAGELDLPG